MKNFKYGKTVQNVKIVENVEIDKNCKKKNQDCFFFNGELVKTVKKVENVKKVKKM